MNMHMYYTRVCIYIYKYVCIYIFTDIYVYLCIYTRTHTRNVYIYTL